MTIDIASRARALVQGYLVDFPSESDGLQRLTSQLADRTQDPFDRLNMTGHVTASALVFDQATSRVLMVKHPLYGRWLPPGGHVEPDCEFIWDAAAAEVAQETGLHGMEPLGTLARYGAPLDIDTHAIPANPKKSVGAHWHHDFLFAAVAPNDFMPVPLAGDAVRETMWMPLTQFLTRPGERVRRLGRKIESLATRC